MTPPKQQLKASAYHLTSSEVRKLIVAAHSFRDRCIIKALYWFGLRRFELTALDIRDIDFERRRLTVREGKGGKTRVIPSINDECVNDLLHLIGARRTGAVFLSNQDTRLSLHQVNNMAQ